MGLADVEADFDALGPNIPLSLSIGSHQIRWRNGAHCWTGAGRNGKDRRRSTGFAGMVLVRVFVALLFLVAGTWGAQQKLATGVEYSVHGVAAGDKLNVRAEPGAKAKVVFELPPDAKGLRLTGRQLQQGTARWVEIQVGDEKGWVNAAFLEAGRTIEDAPAAEAAPPSGRVALVIGNSAYVHSPPLKNPRNDALVLNSTLSRIGFSTVDIVLDGGKRAIEAGLDKFFAASKNAELSVIYYSGHGLEMNGINYLIPVDADLRDADDVPRLGVSVTDILRRIDGNSGTKLVVLDACRTNPFGEKIEQKERSRALPAGKRRNVIGRGLAAVATGRNTLVAYSAKHGSYAFDGDSKNSPFVEAMLRNLRNPGVEVGLLFRRVRDDVLAATAQQQEPFTYGSIGGQEVFLWPVGAGILMPEQGRFPGEGDVMKRLRRRTDALILALQRGDYEAFSEFVHPQEGVLLDGVRLLPSDLIDGDISRRVFAFEGMLAHEGYGDKPAPATLGAYLKEHVFATNYLATDEVSFNNGLVGGGADLDQLLQGHPGAVFVDYLVPAPNEPGGESRWKTLRLIFQNYLGRWFLVEIVQKGWTP